jgi:hypothetical protein
MADGTQTSGDISAGDIRTDDLVAGHADLNFLAQ